MIIVSLIVIAALFVLLYFGGKEFGKVDFDWIN